MAVIHLPRLIYGARSTTAPATTMATIPLWALIVTVIGGTVILVTALASTLIFLQRWRRRRWRKDGYRKRAIMIDGREVSVYRGGGDTSTETLERIGKLRKRIRVERDAHEGDGSDSEEETGLRRPLSLPPVLPMIKRASSGLFSVSSSRKSLVRQSTEGEMMTVAVQRPEAGHRRRTSNAWVDEDAIHGPMMNVSPRKGKGSKGRGKGKDRKRRSWRRSIRDSWPLKTLSPTLPKIASFSSLSSPQPAREAQREAQQQVPARTKLHDAPSTFRFQHHLATIPRLTIPAGQQDAKPQYSPPRQLPKPPQQALLAANNKTAGTPRSMSPVNQMYMPRDRGLSYYIYEDTGDRPVPAPLRLSKGKPNPRFPSSESTLTHILSTTDRRLAEGGTRRSQGSLRPSAMGRERSGTVSTGVGGESSITLVGSSTASGSPAGPPKPSFRTHARMDSQDSALSDDSLLALPVAEPSPGLGLGYFHGLSSPSRGSPSRQQQHVRQPVQADSPESALSLSTCPEVDETAIEETPTKEASSEPNTGATSKNQDNDDPFVVLRNGPNVTAERRVPPASRAPGKPIHAFNDAPRLSGGPSQLLGRNEITLSFLRSDSPLSTISGNSRSPDLRPRRSSSPQNVVKTQTPRGGQQIKVYLPAPTSAVSSTSHLHRRSLSTVADEEEDEGTSVPGISLTSPSDNDKHSPAAKRLADLRAKASSPTLGRNRDQTPDMLPPRPALPRDSIARPPSSYYETHSDNDAASLASSTHRHAAGELRKPSNTSSSHYTDFEREKMESLSNLGLSSQQQQQQEQQRRSQTIRLVPSEPKLLPVSSTVAQLRRMNSAVSAYSHAASGHSEGSSTSSVLPTLREEETGRFVTPPRKREASRNYLSLGNVPAGMEYRKGESGSNTNNKENERHDDMEIKIPQIDFGCGVKSWAPDPPTKRFLRVETSPERKSVDSLGLYDADGFWISPERRTKRRN